MGIFDKRKENKADKRAKVVAYIEKFPTKLATQDKKYRKDPDIALIALKGSVDAWEGVDKSLKKNKDFIALAVKQDAAVIKKLYPEPIDNLLIAKYFYRLNKDAMPYFSKKIQHQIDVEENARKVRQEADAQAMAKASVKFSSVLPVVETEEDIKKREAEEEAKKALKTLTPEEEALLSLVRTLFVDDKIKVLDPEKDAKKIEAIKKYVSAKIAKAVKAVGTTDFIDEEGNSLFYNFFKYNRSEIVWEELKNCSWKNRVKIDKKALDLLKTIEDKDSALLKDVKQYVNKYNKYKKYCNDIIKGTITIKDIPEDFLDKNLCLLYIENAGYFAFFDIPEEFKDFDVCYLAYTKNPNMEVHMPHDIAMQIKEKIAKEEDSEMD